MQIDKPIDIKPEEKKPEPLFHSVSNFTRLLPGQAGLLGTSERWVPVKVFFVLCRGLLGV